jgi:Mrp family chromosome partitioning ATPase
MTQGVLVVIEANSTKRDVARAAIRRLRAAKAHLLGCLFTKFDIRKAGYAYGYAYSYGYGRGYGFDYGQKPQKVEGLVALIRLGQGIIDGRRN